ncbi:hypothetical protein AB0M28_32940 [Streptomyces sp. NPDC051940]|uniref:hypothetical protein n=1 Tax=Streptomyces sp. NPDC051940 TaxID=3155675 RepID=UPI0034141116
MTTYDSTGRLWQAAHQLRDDVLALRLAAVEDRPRREPNKLVDDVGAAGDALAGWAEEVTAAAARALAALDRPREPHLHHRALADCAAGLERLGAQLHDDLAGPARLDELSGLARRGGPEPRAWVGAIKQAVDRVQRSVPPVQGALTGCWRELAERAGDADVRRS